MSSRNPIRNVTPYPSEEPAHSTNEIENVPLPLAAPAASVEFSTAGNNQNQCLATDTDVPVSARFFYPYLPIDPSYNPSTIYNGRTPASHYDIPPLVNLSAFFIAVSAAAIYRGGGDYFQRRQLVSMEGHLSAILSWEHDSELGGHMISVDKVQGSFYDANAHLDHLVRESGEQLGKEQLKDLAVRTLARVVAMHQIGPQQKKNTEGQWENVGLLHIEQLEKIGCVVGGLAQKEVFENEVAGVTRALMEYHAM